MEQVILRSNISKRLLHHQREFKRYNSEYKRLHSEYSKWQAERECAVIDELQYILQVYSFIRK